MNDLIFELDGDASNELIFELGNAAIIAGDVTKAYVDQQDEATLETAKSYTDDSTQGKIDKPEDAPVVGKVLKVKSVNEDGSFVCEWADSSGGISDVQVNGISVVADGVANVPIARHNVVGAVSVNNGQGISLNGASLRLIKAENSGINARVGYGNSLYGGITTNNIDYAVKAAMCDGKGAAWSATEQTSAQARMGIVTLTQQEYDLLPVKGESTIYLIVG